MQLRKHSIGMPVTTSALERVFAGTQGLWDDALIFAASAIMSDVAQPTYSGEPVVREIRTDRCVYTLRGQRAATPDGFRPIVSVTAEPVPPHLPPQLPQPDSSDKARKRFLLTRKEVRVAQLLAARKSNAEIAAELCISPHTARHHTQAVLGKLGVRSRYDVAGALA